MHVFQPLAGGFRAPWYDALKGPSSAGWSWEPFYPRPPGDSWSGYSQSIVNAQSGAYTTVWADQYKIILHPSADTTARTFTIDSNANVPYPLGTVLTIINQDSGGVITIALTSDTIRLAGAGTTGDRTLAANGIARATKVTATEWIIEGTGLT
jgi:hypothetical protein